MRVDFFFLFWFTDLTMPYFWDSQSRTQIRPKYNNAYIVSKSQSRHYWFELAQLLSRSTYIASKSITSLRMRVHQLDSRCEFSGQWSMPAVALDLNLIVARSFRYTTVLYSFSRRDVRAKMLVVPDFRGLYYISWWCQLMNSFPIDKISWPWCSLQLRVYL